MIFQDDLASSYDLHGYDKDVDKRWEDPTQRLTCHHAPHVAWGELAAYT